MTKFSSFILSASHSVLTNLDESSYPLLSIFDKVSSTDEQPIIEKIKVKVINNFNEFFMYLNNI